MAYPFQPYQAYQQPYQQTYQPSGIIWVSGEAEAQMYPIAPNNAVALWERSGKAVYLKSADATGRPSLVAYDLAERVSRPAGASFNEGAKTTPDYATKADLERVAGNVDRIVQDLRKEFEKLKGEDR